MNSIRSLTVALLLLASTGCGSILWEAPVAPPRGLLFTDVRGPLTPDPLGTRVSEKSGEASTLYVRDILITGQDIAWDDCSIEKAARSGGLTKVHYADYEALAVLGVFGKFTVRAYGE
jgi:hypothetical protein